MTVAAAGPEHKGLHPHVLQTFEMIARDFWPNVDKTDCCWLWRGRCETSRGAPRFHLSKSSDFGPKYAAAHHVAWLLEYGRLPKPKSLVRLCENKLCVRPSHYQKRAPPPRTQRKKIPQHSPAPVPVAQPVPGVAPVATVETATDSAQLARLGAELREHTAAEREVARLVLQHLGALGRALLTLREQLGQAPRALPDSPALGRIEGRLSQLEQRLAALSEDVASVARSLVKAQEPTEETAAPAPEPADRPLKEFLCEAFETAVGPCLDPLGPAYLDDVLELALRACDADPTRAGRTFERWLHWYGTRVRAAEDGQGPKPTPEGFFRAVAGTDETRPPPVGPVEA